MVIVLKKESTREEKENLCTILEKKNFKLNEVVGEEDTIIAAVGKVSMDVKEVELIPGVAKVIPISKPYKMASRQFKKDDTVVEIINSRGQKVRIGGSHLVSIAGPCAVESRQQIMEIAKAVAESGGVILKGGTFMPRSSPYSFQGLGKEGLEYLREAGDLYGLPVVTEVVSENLIELVAGYADILQIGARNMQNFDLLKKVGATGKPVILKRSYTATLEEFLMSAEYLLASGTDNVILCERGIRTFEHTTYNTLDLSAVPVLQSLTHLPIIVDPSHAVGLRDKISPMALASVASGAAGIVIDVHTNPEKAMSGGARSMLPFMFDKLMHDVEALAPVMGKSVAHIRKAAQKSVEISKTGSKDKNGIVVAYSGARGAYAEQAIDRYFDKADVNAVSVNSFSEIFQNVTDGKADFGMVPIENSLAGSVYQNYDNFSRFQDVSIVGTVTLNIRHALLGVKGASLDDVKNVYSHPQGLAQCGKFLGKHKDWSHNTTVSTSGAAVFVADEKSKENAAICSAVNAELYGLDILARDIEDDPSNFTRFVVIQANNVGTKADLNIQPNIVSYIVKTKNQPGALYNLLGVFEENHLNLTRLESRPIAGEQWRYWFYIDAELKGKGAEFVPALTEMLNDKCEEVRLLGVYSDFNK